MAFHIVAEKYLIDWDDLNKILPTSNDAVFDFFPIINTEYNALGISINDAKLNKPSLEFLEMLVRLLLERGYRVYELYNGSEVNDENGIKGLKKILME
jgi:hypothetical protein